MIGFCFITIPGIQDVMPRLNLYLALGQAALLNTAIAQAESIFKAAITLMQEVPPKVEIEGQGIRSTEEQFMAFMYIQLIKA